MLQPYINSVRKRVKIDLTNLVKPFPLKERVSLIGQFRIDFENIIKSLVGKKRKVVVFIDDLDRCSPGNIVEVLHEADGELVCCEHPMKLFNENTFDAAKEKHVPVMEKSADGLKVTVGSVPHPMEEKHYIEWVEIISGEGYCRKFLKPGQLPEVVFDTQAEGVVAREYCNIHGLWKS